MGHDQKYVDKKYEVVGTRFNRPDGIDKVTGKARYGADASAPGQLVGRVSALAPRPRADSKNKH
jgi:CO/xanthine dehydrogenase Mo-binding subunit